MARTRRAMNVANITKRIAKDLERIGDEFRALGRAIQSRRAGVPSGRGPGRPPGRRRRARRPLTAGDRARLKVQGEYLGLVRHLSVRNRNKIKELRAKKGYTSAIRMARRMGKVRG